MIPIRDTIRSRSFPFVNWLIIILNSLIFFYQSNLSSSQLDAFIQTFALIPAQVNPLNPVSWYPLLTHMWLHASFWHLLGNMWVLFIFGDNVEDRLGSTRYLIFYLLGGISAGLLQYFFSAGSDIAALGASGAIAGVMGAYFVFYPNSKVVTFVPILFFGCFARISSYVFFAIWFGMQLFSGVSSLASAAGAAAGGVAWWAHVGGFLFGLIMARPFCIGRCQRQVYVDEHYPW
jgi:membrane associated rhomboid family serine protease